MKCTGMMRKHDIGQNTISPSFLFSGVFAKEGLDFCPVWMITKPSSKPGNIKHTVGICWALVTQTGS